MSLTESERLLCVSVARLLATESFNEETAAMLDEVSPPSGGLRTHQLLAHGGSVAAYRWYLERGAPFGLEYPTSYPIGMIVTSHLHRAIRAKGDCYPLVSLLLAAGANPNDPSSWGITPLMYCVGKVPREWIVNRKGVSMDVVRLLLEAGADPLLEDKEGRTIFDYVESVYDHCNRNYGLTEAMWREKRELVALLRAWA